LPDITAADLEAAAKEAEDAQTRFLALEFAALHNAPDKRPSAAEVVAQRQEAEHAAARVEVTRKRLEQAKEAARLESMHAVGAQVGQLAAEAGAPSAERVAEVRQLAELAASIRARASGHDATVKGLYDEAARLHGDPKADPVKRTGQAGPWAPHMPPLGVKYGNISVHVIGGAVDQAIAAAVSGDVDGALKLLTPVKDHTQPEPTAVYRDTLGQFGYPMEVYGNRPDRALAEMIRDGRAVLMTPDEVTAWRAGRR